MSTKRTRDIISLRILNTEFAVNVLAALAVAAALITFSSIFSLNDKDARITLRESELIEILAQAQSNEDKLAKLNSRIDSSSKNLESLIASSENIELAALKLEVERQSKELLTLKEALGDDVEKALSVALLRKDLEAIKSNHEELLDSTGRSVDRVYDQNKWFLGLMATMSLSVVGLTFSVFSSRRKENEKS